jgi:hypothetical protein
MRCTNILFVWAISVSHIDVTILPFHIYVRSSIVFIGDRGELSVLQLPAALLGEALCCRKRSCMPDPSCGLYCRPVPRPL